METLLNLEDYTIAADDSTENHATDRSDWQGWAIGDRFQIPRKIKKFSKLFGVWTVTDRWQSGKNEMLTISDGLRTLNQPVKELDASWKIVEMEPELESAAPAEPTSVAVEVVQADSPVIVGVSEAALKELACVERIDELSYEEERDRLHLERKVERAFYEAGKALRELRDRRLYRSTHKTFESYCRGRFGFARRHPYQLIDAASVVDNLLASAPTNSGSMCAIGAQTEMTTNGAQAQMGTNGAQTEMTTSGAHGELLTNGAQTELSPIGAQVLPTNERQVRSLVPLEPEQQREVWQKAIAEAGGKVPSGRIVKDIVERMQQVESPPQLPTRAHHLTLEAGGLVEVRCPGNEKIHCRHGRIASVREKTVEVWVRDTETMVMVKHTLKHQQVEVVAMENEPGLRELCDRFARLRGRSLDPFDREILELLERAVVLTPREVEVLEAIEGRGL